MKTYLIRFYATMFMLFISFLSFADEYDYTEDQSPSDPPAGEDVSGAPINAKLVWLAVLGIAFAYFYFIKIKKETLNEN